MSKMTHKRKCEIVAALKVNERGWKFFSNDERAVIKGIDWREVLFLDHRDGFESVGSGFELEESDAFIYRIKQSYTVPIEPHENCRMVTMDERRKYTQPVQAFYFDQTFGDNDWHSCGSSNSVGWNDSLDGRFDFCVPLDFSFEPEEMTLAEVCKLIGRDIVIKK